MVDYDITSDGRTVWINTEKGCIGRFGLMGIDIHREIDKQMDEGECLYCTKGPPTRKDWDTFVEKMKEFYGITVRQKFMPTRFKEESC